MGKVDLNTVEVDVEEEEEAASPSSAPESISAAAALLIAPSPSVPLALQPMCIVLFAFIATCEARPFARTWVCCC